MKKKTIILSALLIVFSVNQASAQLGFQLGIKGGLNLANASLSSNDITENADNRTGYHLGAFALIKTGKIGIQPEVLYSTQGFSQNITDPSGSLEDLETQFNANYINIPIIVKLYLAQGLNIQVGPQLGFASKVELVNTIMGVETTTDIKDVTTNADFGVAFGAGLDLPFGLNVGARYNLGISDISNDDDDSSSTKNQVFQISVGYAFIKK